MEMYVISLNNRYVGIDYSAGMPTWTDLSSAKMFNSIQAAEEFMQGTEWTKEINYGHGRTNPPYMIWTGLGICNDIPKAEGYIRIEKIVFEVKKVIHVKGEAKGWEDNG